MLRQVIVALGMVAVRHRPVWPWRPIRIPDPVAVWEARLGGL